MEYEISICSSLTYTKLVEPKTSENVWCKATMQYVVDNMGKVKNQVRMKSAGLNKNQIEDIFSNLIMYLASAEDFDPTKENACKSVENYVGVGINYVIQRYRSEISKENKHIERNIIIEDDNGEEKNILDWIPDKKATESMNKKEFDLEKQLRSLEGIRYINNFDIYNLFYVRLLSSNNTEYEKNLMALGLERKGIIDIYKIMKKMVELNHLAKAITLINKDKAINILEKYVYGHKMIRRAIIGN